MPDRASCQSRVKELPGDVKSCRNNTSISLLPAIRRGHVAQRLQRPPDVPQEEVAVHAAGHQVPVVDQLEPCHCSVVAEADRRL